MSRTMENKIGRLVSGIGQNAKDVLEKTKNLAVQVADQNDDGKFDWKMFLSWHRLLEML